jgi:hypothetical protein
MIRSSMSDYISYGVKTVMLILFFGIRGKHNVKSTMEKAKKKDADYMHHNWDVCRTCPTCTAPQAPFFLLRGADFFPTQHDKKKDGMFYVYFHICTTLPCPGPTNPTTIVSRTSE